MPPPIQILETKVYWSSIDDLPVDDQELVQAARRATAFSTSPYSNFKVGCAIRLRDGSIVVGANQENASYGLTVCAERTTIHSISNQGKKRDIVKLAVTARPSNVAEDLYCGTKVITPCGACRQVIKEAEDWCGQPITIFMDCYDDDRIARVDGIDALLPMGFGPKDLGISLT